jgi:hypothetical protein
MQLLTQPGDLRRLLGQLLLPPDAGDGSGDRNEIGGRGEQHAALERPFPQRIVLLQRRGQEMLAGDVKDDIVRRVAELRPIVLRAELLGMPANRGGMRGEMGGAAALLMRVAGVEERVQRAFRVDDQLLAAGQAYDHVGPQPPVLGVHRNLGLEIGMLRQAGLLEHVAQALLAPAAARLGAGAQRIDQLGGLVAHLGVAGMKLLHRLAQRLITAHPLLLDFVQPLLVAQERFLHRCQQRLHLRLIALPRLGEALIGAVEKILLGFT